MGLMQHHAIVATTWNKEHFKAAKNWIKRQGWTDAFLFGEPKINYERTIVLIPDGSKEGWDESDIGDMRRNAFIEFMKTNELYFNWVEVEFGELGAKVSRTNQENKMD